MTVITDKLEVDGALILPPSLPQCSVLRVFKLKLNNHKTEDRWRGGGGGGGGGKMNAPLASCLLGQRIHT